MLQSPELQHITKHIRVKEINVREMRASIGQLDALVDTVGELNLSRLGKAIARILPVVRRQHRPDHADLRARMPRLSTPSATLIRDERYER